MTIYPADMRAQVEGIIAEREAHHESMNAQRLAEWQGRCFRDPVSYEKPTQPPKWPAHRSSIDGENITPLRRKRA